MVICGAAPLGSGTEERVPKLVDHDERRAELVAAAGRLIARNGLEAATVRAIAAEAGCSTGVLDHYFADKDDLLLQALAASHQRISDRFARVARGRRGLAAVRALLADNLPTDASRRDETRLEVQFWARSLGDRALLEVQRREMGAFRRALGRHLEEAVADGETAAGVDADDALDRLLALMDGLSVRAVLEPARLPATRQRTLLDQEVDRLRASGVPAR
jgi:AcrR family transcriptional regulator